MSSLAQIPQLALDLSYYLRAIGTDFRLDILDILEEFNLVGC